MGSGGTKILTAYTKGVPAGKAALQNKLPKQLGSALRQFQQSHKHVLAMQ